MTGSAFVDMTESIAKHQHVQVLDQAEAIESRLTSLNQQMDLPTALAYSCDTYFYRLGDDFWSLPKDRGQPLQRWAKMFGRVGVAPCGNRVYGPPAEASGTLPLGSTPSMASRHPNSLPTARNWTGDGSIRSKLPIMGPASRPN